MARKPARKVRGYAQGGSVPGDGIAAAKSEEGTRMLMAGIEAGTKAAQQKMAAPGPNPARGYSKGGVVPKDGKKLPPWMKSNKAATKKKK